MSYFQPLPLYYSHGGELKRGRSRIIFWVLFVFFGAIYPGLGGWSVNDTTHNPTRDEVEGAVQMKQGGMGSQKEAVKAWVCVSEEEGGHDDVRHGGSRIDKQDPFSPSFSVPSFPSPSPSLKIGCLLSNLESLNRSNWST